MHFQAMIKIVVSHGWGVFGYLVAGLLGQPFHRDDSKQDLNSGSLECHVKPIFDHRANKAMHLHSATFHLYL
jgi:hypothetical protein